MSFRFFVVWSKTALAAPKLYKRQMTAIKKSHQCLSYQMEGFLEEEQAREFFREKKEEEGIIKRQRAFDNLKKNLELDTEKVQRKEVVQKTKIVNQLSESQKQQRLKYLRQQLEDSKVFKVATFKYSQARIDPSLEYEGQFDGCSIFNPGTSGIGYVIRSLPQQKKVISRSEFIGAKRTNNVAELIALILMLGDAYCNGITNLRVYGDSKLIINYMNGNFKVQSLHLLDYVDVAKTLSSRFSNIYYSHISRTFNLTADLLAKKGASRSGKK